MLHGWAVGIQLTTASANCNNATRKRVLDDYANNVRALDTNIQAAQMLCAFTRTTCWSGCEIHSVLSY